MNPRATRTSETMTRPFFEKETVPPVRGGRPEGVGGAAFMRRSRSRPGDGRGVASCAPRVRGFRARLRWTPSSFAATSAGAAAKSEASAPIRAASCAAPSGNATWATKSATVNPMPATNPRTSRSFKFIPSGKPHRNVRAARAPASQMPRGLPSTRPVITRPVAGPPALKETPAFTRPNRPRMSSTGVRTCASKRWSACRVFGVKTSSCSASSAQYGSVGMIGSNPKAGWSPAPWKPIHDNAPGPRKYHHQPLTFRARRASPSATASAGRSSQKGRKEAAG